MLKKNLHRILTKIANYFGWKLVLIPNNTNNRMTATKSDLGFWYAGNVFDSSDIAHGIFRNGLVEKTETDLVIKILNKILAQEDQINFYDIGANSGYYGILAAHLGKGQSKTYSFEPLHEYVLLIEESAKLNRLENQVRVFETALGENESKAKIEIAGSGSSLVPGFLGKNTGLPMREITVNRLDSVVEKEKLPLPHFIKIDVEGFELEVLQGGLKTITGSLPVLFVEVASSLTTDRGKYLNNSANAVFDLLHELGYNAYIVQGKIESVTTVSLETGVYMYLFLNKNNPLHDSLN